MNQNTNRSLKNTERRRGSIVLLSAVFLMAIFAFTAFTVDLGYIVLTKAELQTAADAAALASVNELSDNSEEPTFRNQLVISEAVSLARMNYSDNSEILVSSDIRIGKWDSEARVFNEGQEPANAVNVTTRRAKTNGNALPLFFAPIFNHETADVHASATVMLSESSMPTVPMALRASGFGPIDQKISAANPGKDGPSEPPYGDRFQKNDVLYIGLYGKGKKSAVHLTLDVRDAGYNPQAVLRGDDEPVPMNIDDEFTVINSGTGSNAYNVHLEKRLDEAFNSSKRTFYAPIVDVLPDSRNSSGELTGFVKVVGFVKVHLDGIESFETPDPNNSNKTISNEALVVTVLEDQLDGFAATGIPGGSGKVVR
jgi:Flp pilus assembly protein TadG